VLVALSLGGCTARRQAAEMALQQRIAAEKRARALAQARAEAETQAQIPKQEALVLETIYFDFRKHQIREDQKKVLLRHAEKLKTYPQVKVSLEGHCDERGPKDHNKDLGLKRAESAKKILVEQGIAPERLQTVSYGEERPVDKGKNEAAWSRNRRVEFIILPP